MLFYFTGTGNSLYAAKQLEEKPVSIPHVIRSGNLDFTAESIGIVAPVYGHEVPPMVKEFMEKAAFHTDYFYMVLTYGNRHGGAAELAERFCRACGILPNYINVLLMVDNWLPGFDMEEQKSKDKKVDECLEKIITDIHSRKNMIAEVTDDDRTVHRQFLENMKSLPNDEWKHLIRVKEECIGCGLCARVCPSGSIQIKQRKAVHFPKRCQTCLACVHLCPHKAMGLNVSEKNQNARYINEHISVEEIIEANNQI